MARKRKFPKLLYVKNVQEDNVEYFAADENMPSLIPDDDPVEIAKYQLVESDTWVNQPQLVKHK